MKITILLLLVAGTLWAHAQDHRLYKFALKETGEYLTWDRQSLDLQEERTGRNELAQLFILKREAASRKVIIAPAADPTLCLKRMGQQVQLATYEVSNTIYWDIRYLGVPYAGLTDPEGEQLLSWQEGAGIQMETISVPLNGNDDPSGNHYRFRMEPVNNTF